MKLLEMPEFKASDLIATDIAAMAEMSKAIKQTFAVGSLWISTSPTSPQEIIGGHWKAIGSGRVLVTAGFTNRYWNGNSEVTEVRNQSGLEGGQSRHAHLTSMGFDGQVAYCLLQNGNPIYNSEVLSDCQGFNIQKSYNISHTQVRVAYTRDQSSMPPYYTVYMWERTS